jgi:hypothetical protein
VLHNQLRELERRPEWALAKQNYRTPTVAWAWVERTNATTTRDPVKGAVFAKTTLRLTKLVGHRCLRVAGVCCWASAQRSLGKLDVSKRSLIFAFSFARGCNHCMPDLNRKYCYLLIEQGMLARGSGHIAEALAYAERALQAYEERLDTEGTGKALVARAQVHIASGSIDLAISDSMRAITVTPISASESRDIAFQVHVRALSLSSTPSHSSAALGRIPDLRERFKGHRGNSAPLALIDALEAGLLVRVAETAGAWDRAIFESKARHLYVAAIDFFDSHAMPLETIAVQTDLAAFEAKLAGRERTMRLLRFPDGAPESLRPLMQKVQVACATSDAAFWGAMRQLRDATTELGAGPPLVLYGTPA